MAVDRQKKLLRFIGPFLGLVLFGLAFWILGQALEEYRLADILTRLKQLKPVSAAAALVLVAAAYLALTSYDYLAFRYVGRSLPYRKIGLASFVGYTLTNNTGGSFSFLAGGSIRYRLYAAWGLSTREVGQVVAFCVATFWLGFLSLAGTLFLFEPVAVPARLGLPEISSPLLGAIFLCLVGLYLFLNGRREKPLTIRGLELRPVSLRLALAQILLSTLQWLLVGSALFVLLPATPDLSFPLFMGLFLMAFLVGTASQVPGGLGIFETMMVVLLKPYLAPAPTLGSLLVFRGFYYLLPLGLAAALLGGYELYVKRRGLSNLAHSLGQKLTDFVPQIMALLLFGAGILLLLSGTIPAWQSEAAGRQLLPPVLEEGVALLRALAGLLLLLSARGVWERQEREFRWSILLLGAAMLLSLPAEHGIYLAATLGVLLLLLLPWPEKFRRQDALYSEVLTGSWLGAVSMVVGGAIWLGYFNARPLDLSGSWEQLSSPTRTGRFWRINGALVIAHLLLLGSRWRSAPDYLPTLPTPEYLETAARVARRCPSALAWSALLGDKEFLFSEDAEAFLMFAQQGGSRIALGDPLGPAADAEELIRRFRRLCRAEGDLPVIFNAGAAYLPLYLEFELLPLKIGEEALVHLPNFSGRQLAPALDPTCLALERGGWSLEIIPPAGVPARLPELRQISHQWLQARQAAEKRFAFGSFQEDYLRRLPVALVRSPAGRSIGFAVLWPGGGQEELRLDLLRFLPEAPPGFMDFLLLRLLDWSRKAGFQWLNLGLTPLAKSETVGDGPAWSRRFCPPFPGLESVEPAQLRPYKVRFRPVWKPRYLVSPSNLLMPAIAADLNRLSTGGGKS